MTNQFDSVLSAEDQSEGLLGYNPNRLLDTLLQNLSLKNDAALSRALEVAPPVISKIRHHRLPVGASLLIRMHEVSGLSIKDLRYLMGDRRDKFRMSDKQFNPNNPNNPNNANSLSNTNNLSSANEPNETKEITPEE
jgi:hypothetical protein